MYTYLSNSYPILSCSMLSDQILRRTTDCAQKLDCESSAFVEYGIPNKIGRCLWVCPLAELVKIIDFR